MPIQNLAHRRYVQINRIDKFATIQTGTRQFRKKTIKKISTMKSIFDAIKVANQSFTTISNVFTLSLAKLTLSVKCST